MRIQTIYSKTAILFTLGVLTGICISSYLHKKTPDNSDISKAQNTTSFTSHSASLPTTVSNATVLPLNPDIFQQREDTNHVLISNECAALLLKDSFNINSFEISRELLLNLGIPKGKEESALEITKKHIGKLGEIESRTARLEKTKEGMAYVIPKNPEAGKLAAAFKDELIASLGDEPKNYQLASILINSSAFGGFGTYRKEIYVTDYHNPEISGGNNEQTVVEMTSYLAEDPDRVATLSVNAAPNSTFVKLRFPFLK